MSFQREDGAHSDRSDDSENEIGYKEIEHLADPVALQLKLKTMGPEVCDEFAKIAAAPDGSGTFDWCEIEDPESESKGIKISVRASQNHDIRCFRGVGIVEAPAKDIYDLVITRDIALKTRFDSLIKKMKLIQKIDDETEVLRFTYKTPSILIKKRDFVLLRVTKQLPDGRYVSVSRSVEHTDAPPKRGYTRGEIILSGWLIIPEGPNRTRCITLDQFDPKGKVQQIFETQMIKTKPLVIDRLREYFSNKK